MKSSPVKILGLEFYTGTAKEAVADVLSGGLLVAPAAPGLAHNLIEDFHYREALLNAKICIPDSGLMVLVWNLICSKKKNKIKRVSGLEFLKEFFQNDLGRNSLKSSFWIMPNDAESELNQKWLTENTGVQLDAESIYIAPNYSTSGELQDTKLLDLITLRKPGVVFINVGGGIQERLGYYLQKHLDFTPAILCCGAAIAFLAGGQTHIPAWADHLKLGWLMRCLSNPNSYVPRYWNARTLVPLILKYREMLPTNRNENV